jgi:sortase A
MMILIKRLKSIPMRKGPHLRWIRYFFFATGTLILGYVGFVLIDAQLFQADQSRRFQQELKKSELPAISDQLLREASTPLKPSKSDIARTEHEEMVQTDRAPLGKIEINTIGLAAMILEGTDARTLRRAVGHVPGTPLPGQRGNIVITGHRDTFFRPLRNIRKDNEITLTTLSGSYRYLVDYIKVVEPEDMEVLNNSDDSLLTLVTCYPFYFVGPAPKRFIVRAHMLPV